MSDRTTLQHTYMTARTAAGSRATAREFDDKHLIQQIKKADVFHSETPSNFEHFQPVGLTAVPIKQEQQNQKQQSSDKDQGDWNHNQPKGPAAEVVMNYLNGSRSHPVAAVVDDRRVRPYAMKEGEGAHYAPDGSEQMSFVNENGYYVVSLDGPSVKDKKTIKTRMASLRHVNKTLQSHEIKKGEDVKDHKHEGESINTEVRCIKNRIEFRAGDKVVGYYEVSSDTWYFTGKLIHNEATEEIRDNAQTMNRTASSNIKDKAPRIDHDK